MTKLSFTVALTLVLVAHYSRQAPVHPSSSKGKEHTFGNSKGPPPRFNPLSSHQDDVEIHPTLKAYSDLMHFGYTDQFKDERSKLFQQDPFFRSLQQSKTPAEYAAGFALLRPKQDRKRGKANASLNRSISALMIAHMKHLDKTDDFQKKVLAERARQSRDLSMKERLEQRLRKKKDARMSVSPPTKQLSVRRPQIILAHAQSYIKDMKLHGVKWSDDPIVFEQNSRPLMKVHGKNMSTRKLVEFLQAAGKDDDHIDLVRGSRMRHINDKYWKMRSAENQLRREKKLEPSLSPPLPASLFTIFNSMHQAAVPRPNGQRLHSPIPPMVSGRIHDLGQRSNDIAGHVQAQQQAVLLPAHIQSHASARQQHQHEAGAASSSQHAADDQDQIEDPDWWKSLLV